MNIGSFVVLWALLLTPYLAIAQAAKTYRVDISASNGEKHKPFKIQLFDSLGRVRQTMMADSFGDLKLTGLMVGKYSVKNKKYKVDTTFKVPEQACPNVLFIGINVCDSTNARQAKNDIRKGKPRLLLIGSIAPVQVLGQEKFEQKFGVEYYDFGCSFPSEACVIAYNQEIFKYLDKRYPGLWRKEVRKDVIGLKR